MYLNIQVVSDSEVDNWVQTIHTAGAMALARTQSRDVAQRAVRKELERLEQKMDGVITILPIMLHICLCRAAACISFLCRHCFVSFVTCCLKVYKMVKLSQLPTTIGTVSAYQLEEWEDEIELLHVQHFMAKCYWAALKCQDSPSCKVRLHIFTCKIIMHCHKQLQSCIHFCHRQNRCIQLFLHSTFKKINNNIITFSLKKTKKFFQCFTSLFFANEHFSNLFSRRHCFRRIKTFSSYIK